MSIATDRIWPSTTNLEDSSFTNHPAFGHGLYTSYSAGSGTAKVARVEERWSENRACHQKFEETYPLVLLNRLQEEDWLAIIRKVNEFWGPIAEESQKLGKMDGLLSYTILSVPVHMAKQRRLEHAIVAARRHICFFLDKINQDVRDRRISFALRDHDDPSEGSGVFIEIKRYKSPRRKAVSPTKPATPSESSGTALSGAGSTLAGKSKTKPQFLKREEKWWHFSNEDILAALSEQRGDAERPTSPTSPPAQVTSPRSKSPRATSPDGPSSKTRKKHSPSKVAAAPPDSEGGGKQRQGRTRSNTTDGSDRMRLQPLNNSQADHHLAAPQLQHSQPTLYFQQQPFQPQPQPQQQVSGLSAVPPGQFYQPQLQLQPQPIIISQPPLMHQLQLQPQPQPQPQLLTSPVDPWALSMAPPQHQRLRSQSTETRPAQRDLITW